MSTTGQESRKIKKPGGLTQQQTQLLNLQTELNAQSQETQTPAESKALCQTPSLRKFTFKHAKAAETTKGDTGKGDTGRPTDFSFWPETSREPKCCSDWGFSGTVALEIGSVGEENELQGTVKSVCFPVVFPLFSRCFPSPLFSRVKLL